MNKALAAAAHERMAEAAMLMRCAREGHQGVNVTTSDEEDGYLCERCMMIYMVQKATEGKPA
jgi:hypothetical protein